MPPWFRNWIEHEQRAVNLRIWQPSSLSGLLQTEAYALAQLRTFPGATAEQVTERLSRSDGPADDPHPRDARCADGVVPDR